MIGRSLVAALLLVLAGCSTAARTPRAPAAPGIATGLVLRSGGHFGNDAAQDDMLRVDEQSWEYSRNDPRLNVGWSPPAFADQYATVRTNDWLSTSNGRPNEFSRTHIQTLTERAAR